MRTLPTDEMEIHPPTGEAHGEGIRWLGPGQSWKETDVGNRFLSGKSFEKPGDHQQS